jgi:hypothetical protein
VEGGQRDRLDGFDLDNLDDQDAHIGCERYIFIVYSGYSADYFGPRFRREDLHLSLLVNTYIVRVLGEAGAGFEYKIQSEQKRKQGR